MRLKSKFIGRIFLFSFVIVGCNFNKKIEQPLQKTSRLDSLFNAAVSNAEIPGAVIYITKNKKEVFHKAYGFKNIEDSIPQETNDIFRMASMTKGLTAVAVLQLYEKGLLNLDDKVSKYISEFKNPQILVDVLSDSTFSSVLAKSEITIQQLLTHTSGIGYGFQDDRYNALVIKNSVSEGFCEDQRTSIENTRKIAQLPLLANPGERNIYSMSYDVLSTVIEIVSGLRYDEYVQQHILTPLEMYSSYFNIPISERKKLVKVYQPAEDNNGLILTTYNDINYPVIENKQFFSGGADLCSTAKDYTNFVYMIINNGIYKNKQILGEKYVKMMLSKQTNFDDGDSDQGYAAWVTNIKGAEKGPMSIGSYGFGGFFDTYTWTDPKKQFTATLLLQMYPTNAHNIHEKYQKIVYDIINDL
ncbi:serine hydrolase [uncultured Lutibacter sp.]|uniref:serine hydrolase domain-containing protein n=1 Tax=uncultured Lutibacter sp. TaxID=437739 RepID=UPI002617579F|nr:serine hydrolase domain-containing protein [uncultured Lutibacter sp.]